MVKEICNLCVEEVDLKDMYGFFPEDSSYICKKCFGNNKKEERREYSQDNSLRCVHPHYTFSSKCVE